VLLFVAILSCHKQDDFTIHIGEINLRTSTLFTDTSGWELASLNNIFQQQDTAIQSFVIDYGNPRYDLAFQKRSSDIKITSVPTFKNGVLTGIFKLYYTIDDTTRLEYFSISDLNSILDEELVTEQFHIFRGAIQSVVITQKLANLPISQTFLDWLENNANRIEERVIWYCVEAWDCNQSYTSSTTGWSYNNSQDWSHIGFNLGSGYSNCILLWRECWADFSHWNHQIPGYTGGSPINWNYYLVGGGSGGSGNTSGTSNGNNNNQSWTQVKLESAKECIKSAGLNALTTDTKIKEKARFLCGPSYEDLLIQAYDNLMRVGKNCSDLHAVHDMLSDLEAMVDLNIAWADEDLKDYVSELSESELIDPCRPSMTTDQLIHEAIRNSCNMEGSTIENFNTELFVEVKTIEVDPSLNNCPLIKCGIKNAMKTSQSNMCDFIALLQQSRISYKLKLGSVSDFVGRDNVWAETRFNLSTGISEIHFNPLYCVEISEATQQDRMYMVLSVVHELLHIHIFNQVVKLYLAHGKSLPISSSFENDFTLLLAEEQYCVETIPGVHNQHVIMGNIFVYDLAVALWETNGKFGEPSEYLGPAWGGLWEEGITPDEYMTPSLFNEMWQTFYSNVGYLNLNIKCN
jgi:hypothetical protein